MSIIIAIITLGVIIMIHELGHFTFAKAFKVKVMEFWIFMGPKLFKWKRKETEYSMRCIPIGGMCRMMGEEDSADDEGSFCNKTALQRFFILFGGPLFNIVTAYIILVLLFSINGYQVNRLTSVQPYSSIAASGLADGDKIISYNGHKIGHPLDYYLFYTFSERSGETTATIEYERNGIRDSLVLDQRQYYIGFSAKTENDEPTTEIEKVTEGLPAEQAGVLPGDIITKVNDTEVDSYEEFQRAFAEADKTQVKLTVDRNGERKEFDIVPYAGMSNLYFDYGSGNFFEVIKSSTDFSLHVFKNTYYSILAFVSGTVGINEMSGPVGIVSMMGEAVDSGDNFKESLFMLLQMAALISLSVGVFNLIPFPALDGCKILFIITEKLTGKRIKPEKEAIISLVGLVILVSFICVVTFYNVRDLFY